MYFFVVEIIEENTKLRFNDVLFWCEKIRLLHQVVIKVFCNLLNFVDTGAEIAELCSPWILVVNYFTSFPFWLPATRLLSLIPTPYSYSYSFSSSPPTKRTGSLFLPPSFEFLASVCLHFSIFITLADRHSINFNKPLCCKSQAVGEQMVS